MTSLKDKIKIVTTTFYRLDNRVDTIRAKIAERTIRSISDLGYETIVVDGGSADELLDSFRRSGAVVYHEEERGMGKARRQAIRIACERNPQVLIWTEPEKESYVRFIEATALPILNNATDMVIPRRRDISSYPALQQITERAGNLFWKKLTGTDLDMFFGARGWRKDLSKYFLEYNAAYGDKQDSIHIPILDIIHAGYRVRGVDIDFTYPHEQRAIEEEMGGEMDLKRMQQLYELSRITQEHWLKLSGQKK